MIVFGGSFLAVIKRVRMRNHHAVCKKMRVTVGNRRLDNKQVNRQYQRKNQFSIFPYKSQDFLILPANITVILNLLTA